MWPFSSICQSKVRLTGKIVVITGANGGIGKETARDLYWRGARVILACRNVEKANEAVEDIKKTPPSKSNREQFKGEPGELVVYQLDLTKFSSVRECAKAINSTESNIHLLINNAGVMAIPTNEKTEDGYELSLQSNHLGHFLLTLLLLPKMKASTPGCRIVNVSAVLHKYGQIDFEDMNLTDSYTPLKAYYQSKLANVLFAKELAHKLEESNIEGITTYSLHPGVIPTDLQKHFDTSIFRGAKCMMGIFKPFLKTPELGAQTTIHCAVDEEAGSETGLYYTECQVVRAGNNVEDEEVSAKFWIESLKAVKLPVKENLGDLLDLIKNDIEPPSAIKPSSEIQSSAGTQHSSETQEEN